MSKKNKRRTRKEIDRSLNLSKDGGRSMSKVPWMKARQ